MINFENVEKLKEEFILMFQWYRNTYLSKFKKISYNGISKSNKYNREDKMMLKHMLSIFHYIISNNELKYNVNKFYFLNLISIPDRIEYNLRYFFKNNSLFVYMNDMKYNKLICMMNKRHFKAI